MIRLLAVIIIMVVVNLVMVFAIIKAAGRVEGTVRKYYIAKLGNEEKKEEDKRNKDVLIYSASASKDESGGSTEGIREQTDAGETREVAVYTAASGGADQGKTRYKNSAFHEDYRTMRRMDMLDKNAALAGVMEIQDRNGQQKSVYERLLEMLDFDTAYRLSSYAPEEQERLLREAMEPDMVPVFDSYLATEAGTFSAVGLYGYLKEQAVLNGNTYYVHKSKGTRDRIMETDAVQTVEDDEITEGVKIIYKNKLYDYSV